MRVPSSSSSKNSRELLIILIALIDLNFRTIRLIRIQSNLFYKALFLEGADASGTDVHFNFFAVNNNSLSLEVRLPDLLGVSLGEANIVTKLLSLTGYITYLHKAVLYLFRPYKSTLSKEKQPYLNIRLNLIQHLCA